MDWNPFNSSLFTGAGTPWGPNELPTLSDLYANKPSQDVNAYQGFDTSPLSAALTQAIQSNSARNKQGLQAQFAKMGVDGADRNSAMAQAGADEQNALAQMNADMAWRSYQSKVDALNRANAMWGNQLGLSQQEAKGRGDFWGNLLNAGGGLASTYMLSGALKK
jgi:hypothetical protein